ncbi:MAG: polyketide cyclase, partial [Devosia sp.]|uniref:ester cyclase n=1 Tax=Devosia sp. TaxID=1871048 RepID=UPI00263A1322
AAWNFHSVERAARYFADNVVYFDASVGTPVEGKAAATSGVVANFINAVPDLIWGIRGRPIVSGDRVAFEWVFSGTNTGAWADGTAASNKRFTIPGASVFVIRDGLIVSQSDYYDALGFFKQLGWI